MKNLYNEADKNEILNRLENLKVDAVRQWGNSPTDKMYVITDISMEDFEKEKQRAKELITLFYNNGREKCSQHPHSFFGKLTPDEWGILQWKHFDHHLRQFGA